MRSEIEPYPRYNSRFSCVYIFNYEDTNYETTVSSFTKIVRFTVKLRELCKYVHEIREDYRREEVHITMLIDYEGLL